MRRVLIVVVVLALLGVGAWAWFGGFQQVTAARIETTLVERGVPRPMASCMGARMADRLTLSQLRKLRQLGPADGESAVPISTRELLARLRRVDDPEAMRIAATSAAICAFQRPNPIG